jgi:type II secretory pathway component GspD/PulD (secretin)
MRKTLGALLSLALATAMLATPATVFAQSSDPDTIVIPSLEFDQADVRDALKVLFRTAGLNYTVAPEVQGVVTLSLRDVPFRTALRNILNQVQATWSESGGIFNVIARPTDTGTGNVTDTQLPGTDTNVNRVRRIPLRSADPYFIYLILSGSGSTSMEPETTTLVGGGGGGGFGGGGGGFGGGGFGGGSTGGGFGGGGGGFGGGGFGGGGGGFGGGGGGR